MTNREHIRKDLKNRLNYILKYIDVSKNSKLDFNNDSVICDIACNLYRCGDCPIGSFCLLNCDACFRTWQRYLLTEGDKEHEANL